MQVGSGRIKLRRGCNLERKAKGNMGGRSKTVRLEMKVTRKAARSVLSAAAGLTRLECYFATVVIKGSTHIASSLGFIRFPMATGTALAVKIHSQREM